MPGNLSCQPNVPTANTTPGQVTTNADLPPDQIPGDTPMDITFKEDDMSTDTTNPAELNNPGTVTAPSQSQPDPYQEPKLERRPTRVRQPPQLQTSGDYDMTSGINGAG